MLEFVYSYIRLLKLEMFVKKNFSAHDKKKKKQQ